MIHIIHVCKNRLDNLPKELTLYIIVLMKLKRLLNDANSDLITIGQVKRRLGKEIKVLTVIK